MSYAKRDGDEERVDFAVVKSLSLTSFLEQELDVPAISHGGYVTFSACPACGASKDPRSVRISVRHDSTWKCFSCPEGGSILDAAKFLWGCKLPEAAERLVEGRGLVVAKPQKDRSKEEALAKAKVETMRRAFTKLQDATQSLRNEPVCLNYLLNVRKIPEKVVREAQERGMLGFMPSQSRAAREFLVSAVGEDLLRESGLWKPEKKLPGIAYRPIVFFLPGMASAEFRVTEEKPEWSKSVRYGTLEFPYWWTGEDRQCMIVEGLIDLMSAVALGFSGHVMGLTGCNSVRKEWFPRAAKRYGIKRFVTALDNDVNSPKNPGQAWATKVKEMLDEFGLPNIIKTPEKGDINDILKARSKQTGGV